jgi:hypothetical protein
MAGDGLEAAELLREVGEADGVVEDAVGPVVVGVGPAGDADDGQVLAVGARDGVEHAEPPDCERDGAGPDAARARVPVGGVPGVELVAAADEAQAGLGDQVVEQREVEVPRNREDVVDADLHEATREVAPQRRLPRRQDRRGLRRRGRHRAPRRRRRAANRLVRRRPVHGSDVGVHGSVKHQRIGGSRWVERAAGPSGVAAERGQWWTRIYWGFLRFSALTCVGLVRWIVRGGNTCHFIPRWRRGVCTGFSCNHGGVSRRTVVFRRKPGAAQPRWTVGKAGTRRARARLGCTTALARDVGRDRVAVRGCPTRRCNEGRAR